jgi:hypothetical protein
LLYNYRFTKDRQEDYYRVSLARQPEMNMSARQDGYRAYQHKDEDYTPENPYAGRPHLAGLARLWDLGFMDAHADLVEAADSYNEGERA